MDAPNSSASMHLAQQADRSIADAVFDEYRRLWQDGATVDAHSFLADRPEIADDRDLFLDLIFEELQLRRERGEQIDVKEFAKRYPGFESSLCKLVTADDAFEQRPDLLNEPTPWPTPGDHILGFRLLRPIGQGSFSQVYLSRDLSIGRDVVLKVTREGVGEAQLLSRVKHPNVVEVLSAEDDPITGFSVVCMPYLGETTLSRILEKAFADSMAPKNAHVLFPEIHGATKREALKRKLRNRSYVDQAERLMTQLSGAIASAHAENILHRDIKPTNVLVTEGGDAKVLDFNLSVDTAKDDKAMGGTLPYMSPEQLRATMSRDESQTSGSVELDKTSDVYSLGVLYYELLTGSHPFGPFPPQTTNEEFCGLLRERATRKPTPVYKINPAVPQRLSKVIDKCLAFDPKRRYADATSLHAALTRMATPAAGAKQWLRKHIRTLAAGMAAAFCLAFVAVFARAHQPDPATGHWNQAVHAIRDNQLQAADAELAAAMREGERGAKVHFLRGRLHMLRGDVQRALAELHQAKKSIDDGRIDACLAHCYSAGNSPQFAIAENYYRSAIRKGFANAAIFNNLAYCLSKQRGKLMVSSPDGEPQAGDFMRHAIRLDPNLTSAHYNLARWELRIAIRKPNRDPIAGIQAIERTMRLAKPNAQVMYDAARLYAVGALYAKRNNNVEMQQEYTSRSRDCASNAMRFGLRTNVLANDKLLERANIQVNDQVSSSCGGTASRSTSIALCIDPLANRID